MTASSGLMRAYLHDRPGVRRAVRARVAVAATGRSAARSRHRHRPGGRAERDGGTCAIQCKFYEPDHTLAKGDIDSFFTASGKKPFTNRHHHLHHRQVEQARRGRARRQQIPVRRIGLADLADSPIDWGIASAAATPGRSSCAPARSSRARTRRRAIDEVVRRASTTARPRQADHGVRHRQDVHRAARSPSSSRGEAGSGRRGCCSWCRRSRCCRRRCGSGPPRRRSTMRRVRRVLGRQGRASARARTSRVHDLAFPATTDAAKLLERDARTGRAARRAAMTVVFSTYQSIDGGRRRAEAGRGAFDLIDLRRGAPHDRRDARAARTSRTSCESTTPTTSRRDQAALHDRHAAHLTTTQAKAKAEQTRRRALLDGRRDALRPGVPPPRVRRGRRARAAHRLQGARPRRRREVRRQDVPAASSPTRTASCTSTTRRRSSAAGTGWPSASSVTATAAASRRRAADAPGGRVLAHRSRTRKQVAELFERGHRA